MVQAKTKVVLFKIQKKFENTSIIFTKRKIIYKKTVTGVTKPHPSKYFTKFNASTYVYEEL